MAEKSLPNTTALFKAADYFFHYMPHVRGDESEFYITSMSLLQIVHDCAVRHHDARFAGKVAGLMDDLRGLN